MNCSWRRGSTPTNTFNVNIDLTDATVYITYCQKGQTIVEKTNSDITITSDSIVVELTQEDTLKFSVGDVEIQIRYVKEDGTADASNIITVSSARILKDGLISHV